MNQLETRFNAGIDFEELYRPDVALKFCVLLALKNRFGHDRRLVRFLGFLIRPRPTCFRYGRLAPNYEHYWMSDSDAVNSMDPFEAILWFESRGDRCLTYPTWQSSLLVRTGALVFLKR